MPWTLDRYPPAMQRLVPEIRSKAIEIANAMREEGRDDGEAAVNREAYAQLGCVKTLHIVPGTTRLFEEPGTLEEVAAPASDWFVRWLRARDRALDG